MGRPLSRLKPVWPGIKFRSWCDEVSCTHPDPSVTSRGHDWPGISKSRSCHSVLIRETRSLSNGVYALSCRALQSTEVSRFAGSGKHTLSTLPVDVPCPAGIAMNRLPRKSTDAGRQAWPLNDAVKLCWSAAFRPFQVLVSSLICKSKQTLQIGRVQG